MFPLSFNVALIQHFICPGKKFCDWHKVLHIVGTLSFQIILVLTKL